MSAKNRQTFEKRNRERARLERRARKQEKKDEKKLAAQETPTDDASPELTSGGEIQRPAL